MIFNLGDVYVEKVVNKSCCVSYSESWIMSSCTI